MCPYVVPYMLHPHLDISVLVIDTAFIIDAISHLSLQ